MHRCRARTEEPRATRDRGAALVEAALVLPIVLLVIFAVLELGMMFKSATVASTASRAGVRIASATYAPAPGGPCNLTDSTTTRCDVGALVATAVTEALRDRQSGDTPRQLRIYRATASGAPVGGDFEACPTDCLRYSWDGTGWTYESSSTWTSPDACGATIHSIGVWVSVRHEPSNQLIPLGKTITEHSVMRLEPLPGSACTGAGGES